MLFGDIDASVRNRLILSSKTYDSYASDAMKALKKNFLKKFSTDQTNMKHFQSAYLIVDSSQAGDRHVTLKPIITRDRLGNITLDTLRTDFVHSKKGNSFY